MSHGEGLSDAQTVMCINSGSSAHAGESVGHLRLSGRSAQVFLKPPISTPPSPPVCGDCPAPASGPPVHLGNGVGMVACPGLALSSLLSLPLEYVGNIVEHEGYIIIRGSDER